MSSLIEPFAQILAALGTFDTYLPDNQRYRAHTAPGQPPESLESHISLVNEIFGTLCLTHGLDTVIDTLITRLIAGVLPNSDKTQLSRIIKGLIAGVIYFHDFGKVNENFQADPGKMNNPLFKAIPNNLIGSSHSKLGTYLFILKHIQDNLDNPALTSNEKRVLDAIVILFSYAILRHHAASLNDPVINMPFSKEEMRTMQKYLSKYRFRINEKLTEELPGKIGDAYTYLHKIGKAMSNDSFPLFALIKLNFSLLTAADYLATNQYMTGRAVTDYGILSRKRIEDMAQYLRNEGHTKAVYNALDTFVPTFPEEVSNAHLNRLRTQMAIELIHQLRANIAKRLFYIEAPTGGGKTTLSAIALVELLLADPSLNKAFYVFPFTTLITQTYGALKTTLGLQEDELVELHSKAAFQSKISKEETKDGLYGNEQKDYIDNLFAHFPITLLSHIRFFEILKANNKESNYLLHRLANSVVVIDEIQSYPPRIWDKMLYFIQECAEAFNIRFLLMSATLPKITALNIGLSQKPEVADLLPNAGRYIRNPNFANRVRFNFELLDEPQSIESLAEVVDAKSRAYAEANQSVKTIVEFIYKKSASEFWSFFNNSDFFDEILILSGTTLEHRRREIINTIKNADRKNILLITTQVVEAGVDIDMDLGFKNASLLDSDEQLAGRVNRNASKGTCEVFLFQLDDPKLLYKTDERFQLTQFMSRDEKEAILNTKDFKSLYEKVFTRIDDFNGKGIFRDDFDSYKTCVRQLRFDKVDAGFKIIDQSNTTVFVPINIPFTFNSPVEKNSGPLFSKRETDLLEKLGITPDENNEISGATVWEAYRGFVFRVIENRKKIRSFDLAAKLELKVLQIILSKFTFSLFSHSRTVNKIKSLGFGEEQLGYLYLTAPANDLNRIYTVKGGLNESELGNDGENLFL